MPVAGAIVTLLCCRARPFCAVTLYSPAGMTISGCVSRPIHSGAAPFSAFAGATVNMAEVNGGRRIGGARLHLEDAAVEVDAHLRRRIGRDLDRLAYLSETQARLDLVGAGLELLEERGRADVAHQRAVGAGLGDAPMHGIVERRAGRPEAGRKVEAGRRAGGGFVGRGRGIGRRGGGASVLVCRLASVTACPSAEATPAASCASQSLPPVCCAMQAMCASFALSKPIATVCTTRFGLAARISPMAAQTSCPQLSRSSATSTMLAGVAPAMALADSRSASTSGPLPMAFILSTGTAKRSALPGSGGTMTSASPQLPRRRWPNEASPMRASGRRLGSSARSASRTNSSLGRLSAPRLPHIEPEPSTMTMAVGGASCASVTVPKQHAASVATATPLASNWNERGMRLLARADRRGRRRIRART